jgi:hypothetical protein
MKKEFHANFQSVTENLEIPSHEIPLQMLNIFLNIKSLDLMDVDKFQEIT